MGKAIINFSGGGGIINRLNKASVVTKKVEGYTHGTTFEIPINGILVSVGFNAYHAYSFVNASITLIDGAILPLTLGATPYENVSKISFKIASNNSVNGCGIACVTYIPE